MNYTVVCPSRTVVASFYHNTQQHLPNREVTIFIAGELSHFIAHVVLALIVLGVSYTSHIVPCNHGRGPNVYCTHQS